MTISAVVTRGFIYSVHSVTRAGYDSTEGVADAPVVSAVVTVGSGDVPTWQDFVTAEFRRKHLQHLMVQEEKKLKAVQKKIRVAEKKVKGERTEGILANLFKLEFRKDEIENKIQAIRVEIIPLEQFLEADIDDDDEDLLMLQ